MSILSKFDGDFYDGDYFDRGKQSGKGWLEHYRWMARRNIKEAFAFIDTLSLDESSYVLDVGCAKGNLVRALRMLNIPADGCDISKYALKFAPYHCWNCTETQSWDKHAGQYTHVIIKDVLEHLTKKELPEMLNNITKVAPKIMCVIPMGDSGKYRIPEYHTEISHLIIEDEEWWTKQFAKSGWGLLKGCNHVPGLKDNWMHVPDGNYVFVLERL